ncbi:putative n-carbamoylsarcosine amidase [Diaporthe ampelina]|uniref:Putative n-carbamoylsarcosine amidase n=1 Tax=Diaporthe ampelina TaxID=1214573 RepID=A0A0G2FAA3_9PEZI|nr:putative n-carbamoylsarcosine amidase [Diaporthe ampelina]
MSRRRQGSSASPSSSSPCFPSHEEIVAGCRSFVTSYFQLGFLPKAIFIEAISRNASSISPFLLSCILGIAARFTPALVQKYGSSERATDNFLRLARMMVPTEMYEPSLERTQAFFLLAIAEWGNGDKDRSSVNMGVAVRMASILKLHREESYLLPPGAPAEQVIRAESARRTFWMIHSQENLHAGYSSPAPFPLEDITARLPCDEHDFAFGVNPTPRSVLPGTLPAQLQPASMRSPDRCLFATLIQSHNLWGQVARRACRSDLKTHGTEPWEPESEYQVLTQELRRFEAEMPERHRWSTWNLRGWRSEGLHLAYLAVVMVLRVSNIVERRIYLDEILLSANSSRSSTSGPDTTAGSPGSRTAASGGAPDGFWRAMSDELFAGVVELHEQIDAFAALRVNGARGGAHGEGFPAILVFCVYICGSLASYLWRYPQLCPRIAGDAEAISLRCLQVLGDLHRAWPTSTRWQQGLQQIASPLSSSSSSSGSSGSASRSGSSQSGSSSGDSPPTSCGTSVRSGYSGRSDSHKLAQSRGGFFKETTPAAALDESIIDPRLTASLDSGTKGTAEASAASFWETGEAAQVPAADGADAMSNELFEAEMRTLLSEDVQFGWLDFEHGGD